jgi:ribosomal protein S27AE
VCRELPVAVKSSVKRRRYHPSSCRICDASVADGVPISATGLCPRCGEARELANHRQLKAHDGPFWEWWRIRCLASFGVLPPALDSAPPSRDTAD